MTWFHHHRLKLNAEIVPTGLHWSHSYHTISYWTLKPNSKVGLFHSSFCHQHVRENLPKCSLQRDCFTLANLSPTVWCPLQMCWVLRSKKPVQPRTSSCNPCLRSLSTLATPFENSDEQQIIRSCGFHIFSCSGLEIDRASAKEGCPFETSKWWNGPGMLCPQKGWFHSRVCMTSQFDVIWHGIWMHRCTWFILKPCFQQLKRWCSSLNTVACSLQISRSIEFCPT